MVKSASFKIIWDRKALNNFKQILTFLEKQSDRAPKIVKDAIAERLEIIKINPLICELDRLKESPDKEFRAFVIYSYRVTYQIKSVEKKIRVLRIRHTGMEPLGY